MKILLISIVLFCVNVQAKTYVTLEHVSIDRCGSAWFIKRFIDPEADFVFFSQGAKPPEGVGFGFYGAEYFNKGPDCTFTAWVKKNRKQDNPALQKMNAIVNDVMSWTQGAGSTASRLNEYIRDVNETTKSDKATFEILFPVFDLMYIKFGGSRSGFLDEARKHYDLVELEVLGHFLNEGGKQKLDRLFTANTRLSTLDDESVAKLLGLKFSTAISTSNRPLDALIHVLNGASTEVDSSAVRWIREISDEGIRTQSIDELFGLAAELPDGALGKKAVMFEKFIMSK